MPQQMIFKEPAYFSALKQGLTAKEYFSLFTGVTEHHRYAGEASTAYLTDPESATRIHDHNPQARIVIMLRNPVDRAYSLYKWMTQEGYEYAKDFETALSMEPQRMRSVIPNSIEIEYYHNYLYSRSGFYSEQVRRYLDQFTDQVYIMCFEEFCLDPKPHLRGLCRFLDIHFEEIPLKTENASLPVFHPALQHRLRQFTMYLTRNGWLPRTNKSKRDILLNLGTRPFASHPALAVDTRKQLEDCYREDVENLSRITGINFSRHWFDMP